MPDKDSQAGQDSFSEDRKSNKYLIPNIARALKILEYLAGDKNEAGIAEISKEFGYPNNSVFRVIKSLEYYGYVEENERKYRITSRLLSLGYSAMNNKGLVENSTDVMHALRDELNETVLIGTLIGNEVVIIEQCISFHHIKFTAEIGVRVPIHTSAPGKAILAHLPEDEQTGLFNQITFVRYTNNTVPGMKALQEEMAQVKEQGYAVDDGEEAGDVHCIGVPIFDYRNYPVASLWIVGPDYRLPRETFKNIGDIVQQHALKISVRFGYNGAETGK